MILVGLARGTLNFSPLTFMSMCMLPVLINDKLDCLRMRTSSDEIDTIVDV